MSLLRRHSGKLPAGPLMTAESINDEQEGENKTKQLNHYLQLENYCRSSGWYLTRNANDVMLL